MTAGVDNLLNGNDLTVNGGTLGSGTVNLKGHANTISTLNGTPGATITDSDGAATLTVSGGSYAGTIAGPIALAKSAGAGTLTLTGANTYTGGTIVSSGTFLVNNTTASDTGTGNVTVTNGATLGGTGAIAGTLTVNGGTVMPGAGGTGILTAGSANFSSNGNLRIQVAGYAPGTSYSQLNLGTGSLTLGGTTTLTLDLSGLSSVGTATGLALYGSRTGTFTTTTTTNSNGLAASPTYGATGINAVVTAPVPLTTTSLASSPNPSLPGQTTTFTATVSAVNPNDGTPTGTVTFLNGGTTLANVPLTSGQATYTTSFPTLGSYTIVAVYAGNGNYYLPSTSAARTQVVSDPDSTTTTVSASSNTSVFGQSVTLTATVNAAGGTPTGTITFQDGTTTLASVTLAAGQATYTTTSLASGNHSIVVVFTSNANWHNSDNSAAPFTETISPPSTTTTLTNPSGSSILNRTVTFTATISPNATGVSLSGTVTFLDGARTLGTSPVSGTTATFTTASLSVGTHTITAVYAGDSTFAASTSSPINEIILEHADLGWWLQQRWATPANWDLDVAPNSGDDLIFPATGNLTSTDDLTGRTIHSITITGKIRATRSAVIPSLLPAGSPIPLPRTR